MVRSLSTKTGTRRSAQPFPAAEGTRSLLLDAARRLFAKKGLDGITVKELAKLAGVNVSLVSYYFQGKDGLYRACLEQCGQDRLAATQRLLTPAATPEELRLKLKLFFVDVLEYIAANGDHVKVILRELDSEHGCIPKDIFENTYLKVFNTLVDYFKDSQKRGLIRKEVDPLLLGKLLQSVLNGFARCDYLSKNYFNQSVQDPKYREFVADQMTGVFLNGLLPASPENRT